MREAGLEMVYVGAESGDNDVLEYVKKGATHEEIAEAGRKLKEAGIKVSVTLISGLGGKKYLESHAINSAKLISEMKPDYVGFLTLLLESGAPMYEELRDGKFNYLTPPEVFEELKLFIKMLIQRVLFSVLTMLPIIFLSAERLTRTMKNCSNR